MWRESKEKTTKSEGVVYKLWACNWHIFCCCNFIDIYMIAQTHIYNVKILIIHILKVNIYMRKPIYLFRIEYTRTIYDHTNIFLDLNHWITRFQLSIGKTLCCVLCAVLSCSTFGSQFECKLITHNGAKNNTSKQIRKTLEHTHARIELMGAGKPR